MSDEIIKKERDEFDIGEWLELEEAEYRLRNGEKPGVSGEVLLWVGVVLFVGALMGLAAVLS